MGHKSLLNVVTIGYAKRALEVGARERKRMSQYASVVGELHIIVFTRDTEGYPAEQKEGNLFLYATNTKTRLGMLWQAYQIGLQIINTNNNQWVVSSQDPFETSIVGRAIAMCHRAHHHVQVHGDVFNVLSYKASLIQRIRVIYGRYVIRRSECIRVVSERIKDSLIKYGVSAAKITVLPIQSDLTLFLDVGKKREYIVDKPLQFLYVGRFSSEKNISLLITAFAKVVTQFPEVRLTLLGDGPERRNLECLITSLHVEKQVTISSWRDDVPAVMMEHDVLCLSSDHEGWAMVLLEAAAAGLPVITTDVGCVGECVHDGQHGLVIGVGKEAEFVVALKKYVETPGLVKAHGQAGHVLAKNQVLPEEVFLAKMVEVWAVSVNEKPVILTSNGQT